MLWWLGCGLRRAPPTGAVSGSQGWVRLLSISLAQTPSLGICHKLAGSSARDAPGLHPSCLCSSEESPENGPSAQVQLLPSRAGEEDSGLKLQLSLSAVPHLDSCIKARAICTETGLCCVPTASNSASFILSMCSVHPLKQVILTSL